jgi:hypothetical protein
MAEIKEKKEKIRYDINLLRKFCVENNVELLKDYSKEKINRDKRIEGKCINCVNTFEKVFRQLYISNGYCNVCTKELMKEKFKKTCLETLGFEHPSQSNDIKEKNMPAKSRC